MTFIFTIFIIMRKEEMSVYAIADSLSRPYLPYATGRDGL